MVGLSRGIGEKKKVGVSILPIPYYPFKLVFCGLHSIPPSDYLSSIALARVWLIVCVVLCVRRVCGVARKQVPCAGPYLKSFAVVACKLVEQSLSHRFNMKRLSGPDRAYSRCFISTVREPHVLKAFVSLMQSLEGSNKSSLVRVTNLRFLT